MMIIIICFQTQLPSWSVCHLIPLLIWKIEANIRKVNIGNLASLLTVHILWILAHCNGYWIKTYRSCLNLQRIGKGFAKYWRCGACFESSMQPIPPLATGWFLISAHHFSVSLNRVVLWREKGCPGKKSAYVPIVQNGEKCKLCFVPSFIGWVEEKYFHCTCCEKSAGIRVMLHSFAEDRCLAWAGFTKSIALHNLHMIDARQDRWWKVQNVERLQFIAVKEEGVHECFQWNATH